MIGGHQRRATAHKLCLQPGHLEVGELEKHLGPSKRRED